mmetsp:Transcript_15170/g.41649  ORF Transcript_15170/g.41649 Transcript_15170/m.41649 type:complete len:241 (+) Transcript_15170:408-1130(+)
MPTMTRLKSNPRRRLTRRRSRARRRKGRKTQRVRNKAAAEIVRRRWQTSRTRECRHERATSRQILHRLRSRRLQPRLQCLHQQQQSLQRLHRHRRQSCQRCPRRWQSRHRSLLEHQRSNQDPRLHLCSRRRARRNPKRKRRRPPWHPRMWVERRSWSSRTHHQKREAKRQQSQLSARWLQDRRRLPRRRQQRIRQRGHPRRRVRRERRRHKFPRCPRCRLLSRQLNPSQSRHRKSQPVQF